MSVWVIAEFLAAPGRHDRLRTALEAMIEPSLEEPGCLAYQPYVDPNDGARMLLVGQWTGPDALAEHLAGAYFRHAEQVLRGVLARPASVRELVAAPTP
ncbi:antibiotic biosynthesis monooxygenase [Nonomuraea sp. SMC257]|uniref:Antibiotic biosynthesis monooxygenase n=1 Tax=Nonomuraea montanisoli TaxID=2741721 RepID=A0A7Y6I9F2_9ACTN|nr:putative quinol monooxygenase [Nonomuraea montanisoli]NUW33250.1 antibiotic biosynthesis monooxygenase [Nonomuraea montanisoli]